MNNYFVGVLWFIAHLLISAMNDVIQKYLGIRLHSAEVSFLRFFFSAASLLGIVYVCGVETLRTKFIGVHILRGALLFFAITGWIYGLSLAPVSTATVVTLSIPIFTMILANIFLHEKVSMPVWVASIVGFIGVIIVVGHIDSSDNFGKYVFVFSAIGFAVLDIVNKKFISENIVGMLFYSALVTTILAAPLAIYHWQTPTLYETALLCILGVGANLILYFILKAYTLLQASTLAPYRYLELLISIGLGNLIFHDAISLQMAIGSCVVIVSTMFILYYDTRQERRTGDVQVAKEG